MSLVLVHFKDNYADEFDIFGVRLMDADEWERIQNEITLDDVSRFGFGTNEQINYYSVEEFLSQFWSRPVKRDEAKTLRKCFRGIGTGFGHWPFKWLEFEVSEVTEVGE
jgi:hypothetical protein